MDSRALTIRGQKFLVPFADMFNYAPQAETRDADRGSHFLKYHILGEETFTVKADRDAQPGSQLFEDYGDNPNTMCVNDSFCLCVPLFRCLLVLPYIVKSCVASRYSATSPLHDFTVM